MKINRSILLLYMFKYRLSIKDLADILDYYPSTMKSILKNSVVELDEEESRKFIQCFGVADSVAMMQSPTKEMIQIASGS